MRYTLTVLLAACATTTNATDVAPKGGPRGLRASEHLDVADHHEALAKQSQWPDRSMIAVTGGTDVPVGMPWYRSWDTSHDHERIAAEHRSQAAALHAAYEEACGDRSEADVSVSPLARFGTGGWPTQDGAIVYLSASAGTPDALLAALKCHRAWMMLAPTDMDDCPLDLPGLQVDVRGDDSGVTLVLTVSDRALIPELQRRTATDLEKGHAGTH